MRDISSYRQNERTCVDFHAEYPEHSYLFGLLLSDGCFSWREGVGKGSISLELRSRDRSILERLQSILGVKNSLKERSRVTNFGPGDSVCLTINDMHFRQQINAAGLPIGRKAHIACPPTTKYIEVDFWRGVLDGDGSLGFTGKGLPFISLVTASAVLATAYLKFIEEKVGLRKQCSPNKRDGVYNIMLMNEHAQKLCFILYYEGCLALDAKKKISMDIASWVRPDSFPKRNEVRSWTEEENEAVRSLPAEEAAIKLGRTVSSIRNRKFRLRQMSSAA